jgi:hypothetical protein
MSAFNAELLAVCTARALRCFDLAERIPRSTSFFFDDVHFTERGAAAVGTEVASFLAPILVPSAARCGARPRRGERGEAPANAAVGGTNDDGGPAIAGPPSCTAGSRAQLSGQPCSL